MTDEILGYIYEHFKLTTPEEKTAFVLSLRPEARKLWSSYRNELVKCNYDSELAQIVYLLRYYLPYSMPIKEILEKLKTREFANYLDPLTLLTHLDIAFFGAGPAPELNGFLDYTHKNNWSAKSITAHLFDEKKWMTARKIAKEKILPKILNPMFRKVNRDLIINDWWMAFDSAGIPEGWEFIPKCKLAWFQNCFNESTIEGIGFFVSEIVEQLPTRCLLILIDFLRTDKDQAKFNEILKKIFSKGKFWNDINLANSKITMVTQGSITLNNYNINSNLASDLKRKLFYANCSVTDETSGLILSNDYCYNYAILLED